MFLRFAKMFYYTYILLSLKNNSFYIGFTTDLIKRLKDHNSGKNKATKPFIPYKLIYYEAFLNRLDAKNRERYLKSGWGRRSINKILKNYISQGINDYKSTTKRLTGISQSPASHKFTEIF